MAMAAVPSGSSLYLGQGVGEPSASPAAAAANNGTLPGAITTPSRRPTDTVVDTATQLASSLPLQGAATVAVVVLILCWLFIHWYDRRASSAK